MSAKEAGHVEIYRVKLGHGEAAVVGKRWRWKFVAPNGKVLAVPSDSYASKERCLESVQEFVEHIPLVLMMRTTFVGGDI